MDNKLLHWNFLWDQQVQTLQDKVIALKDQVNRLNDGRNEDNRRLKDIQDEKSILENRLHSAESELNMCIVNKEGLRRDKAIVSTFIINW